MQNVYSDILPAEPGVYQKIQYVGYTINYVTFRKAPINLNITSTQGTTSSDPVLLNITFIRKIMEKHRFNKFYRVFKNDTKVTEVSFNDFKPIGRAVEGQAHTGSLSGKMRLSSACVYSLLPENEMFYGYNRRVQAMEMAKSGALKHIAALIAEGPGSTEKVYQYRFDHYEDLNINLRDSAIKQLLLTDKY